MDKSIILHGVLMGVNLVSFHKVITKKALYVKILYIYIWHIC
jgi:hypothetical protein